MNWEIKVIQGYRIIGVSRNQEQIVVIYNNFDIIAETHEHCSIGKTANSSISAITLRSDDSNPRNAFEYLEVIYIVRN